MLLRTYKQKSDTEIWWDIEYRDTHFTRELDIWISWRRECRPRNLHDIYEQVPHRIKHSTWSWDFQCRQNL